MSDSEDRTLAVIAHLAPVIGYSIGFGQILIPLGILLWKGKESDFVRHHAMESLNFQITMTLFFALAGISIMLLIGIVLIPVMVIVAVVALIAMIQATIKAANGEMYAYPLNVRLVK
ncbi:MAG: DUF4870 domain-containing protein [Candidatus Sericytochromatia bacterium]